MAGVADQNPRTLTVLSWAALAGALLTTLFLAIAVMWVRSRYELDGGASSIPAYQGQSLACRYTRIMAAGFLNPVWCFALLGLGTACFWAKRTEPSVGRLRWALLLVVVQQALLLTLLFLLIFSVIRPA